MGISALQHHAVALQSNEHPPANNAGCMSLPEENISLISALDCPLPEKLSGTAPFMSSLWAPTNPTVNPSPQSSLTEADRQKNLGAYLAALPPSPEEVIPSDLSNPLLVNTSYSLQEAWVHLPTQVRVYLDQHQLRFEKDLGIAYEAPCQNFPDGRWHVFKMKETDPIMAGVGLGILALLNRPLASPSTRAPENPPPQHNPSVNIKIGTFVVGTAVVVGIDIGIRKAFPFLPSEARIIPNLASFYGFQYIMWQSGLIQTASWREVWRPITGALPVMTVIGMPTSILVDKIGQVFELDALRADGMFHAPTTMLSSLALYWQLMKSPAGRSFLTASGTGLSGTLGRIARLGGSAVLLSMLSRGARSGGSYLGLYMGGARPGDETWREGLLDMQAEKIALAQSSQNVFGQTGGSILDATLGGLLDFVLTAGQLVSDTIETGREMEIQSVKEKLIQEGRKTAEEINEKLAYLLSQNILAKGQIDWENLQAQLSEVYGNPEIMQAVYQNFSLIGQREKNAEIIRLAIGQNGVILDSKAVLKIAHNYAKNWLTLHQTLLPKKQAQLLDLGESIGNLKVNGGQIEIIPPELLTTDQQERIENEYLPLSGEVAEMEIMFEAMDKLVSNLEVQ